MKWLGQCLAHSRYLNRTCYRKELWTWPCFPLSEMELCLMSLRGSYSTGLGGAVSTEAVLSYPQIQVAPEVRSRNAMKKPLIVLNYLQTNKMVQCPLIPQGKRSPDLKSVEKKTDKLSKDHQGESNGSQVWELVCFPLFFFLMELFPFQKKKKELFDALNS